MVNRTETGEFDVIVVGLGVMGAATASRLALAGLRVLGLDRYASPHVHGSSHGASRVIREAYYEHPSYVPLVQRAFELWAELEGSAGRTLVEATGALMLGRPDAPVVSGALSSVRAHGIDHDVLSSEEIVRRFPGLSASPDMIGVLERRAGALHAEACVRALLSQATRAGAVLRANQLVRDWNASSSGIEVRTDAGTERARALVLAGGAWMTELAPVLPLHIERQVQLWFGPAKDAAVLQPGSAPIFLYDLEDDGVFYGIPDLGAGLKVARHHGGEEISAPGVRPDVTEADIAPVREFLQRYIPAAAGELLDACVCRYTNTPDHHFVVDRHPAHDNVWLISACSGHGFKFAPVIGEAVAEAVTRGDLAASFALFRLGRFDR